MFIISKDIFLKQWSLFLYVCIDNGDLFGEPPSNNTIKWLCRQHYNDLNHHGDEQCSCPYNCSPLCHSNMKEHRTTKMPELLHGYEQIHKGSTHLHSMLLIPSSHNYSLDLSSTSIYPSQRVSTRKPTITVRNLENQLSHPASPSTTPLTNTMHDHRSLLLDPRGYADPEHRAMMLFGTGALAQHRFNTSVAQDIPQLRARNMGSHVPAYPMPGHDHHPVSQAARVPSNASTRSYSAREQSAISGLLALHFETPRVELLTPTRQLPSIPEAASSLADTDKSSYRKHPRPASADFAIPSQEVEQPLQQGVLCPYCRPSNTGPQRRLFPAAKSLKNHLVLKHQGEPDTRLEWARLAEKYGIPMSLKDLPPVIEYPQGSVTRCPICARHMVFGSG